jgi:predicted DNA binding protein
VNLLEDRMALFSLAWDPHGNSILQVIVDHGAFYSTPISMVGGVESWRLLLPDERERTALLRDLTEFGEIQLHKVARVDRSRLLAAGLWGFFATSARRRQILELALRRGYFDFPRRASSRDLARELGLAQSTILEHLRNAQRQILERILGSPSSLGEVRGRPTQGTNRV